MKNIPEIIYLQIGEDVEPDLDFNEIVMISWSSVRIYDNDIEYKLVKKETNESI